MTYFHFPSFSLFYQEKKKSQGQSSYADKSRMVFLLPDTLHAEQTSPGTQTPLLFCTVLSPPNHDRGDRKSRCYQWEVDRAPFTRGENTLVVTPRPENKVWNLSILLHLMTAENKCSGCLHMRP